MVGFEKKMIPESHVNVVHDRYGGTMIRGKTNCVQTE